MKARAEKWAVRLREANSSMPISFCESVLYKPVGLGKARTLKEQLDAIEYKRSCEEKYYIRSFAFIDLWRDSDNWK